MEYLTPKSKLVFNCSFSTRELFSFALFVLFFNFRSRLLPPEKFCKCQANQFVFIQAWLLIRSLRLNEQKLSPVFINAGDPTVVAQMRCGDVDLLRILF